jgi:hypothetical protein
MRKALVGYTTDRELHPAPKVFIWLFGLYPQLRFDDALDRAGTNTLRRISVTFAFDTSLLIDNV